MEIAIDKILCPVDFSPNSDHALRYALAFACAYGAELVLLHVVELPFMPSYTTAGVPDLSLPVERIREECQDLMNHQVEACKETHANTSGTVVVGTPFLEIVHTARDGKFDLIVVGTHGRSALKQLLIGSVAEKVVRKAPCPVLTVKHPEHEFVMP